MPSDRVELSETFETCSSSSQEPDSRLLSGRQIKGFKFAVILSCGQEQICEKQLV